MGEQPAGAGDGSKVRFLNELYPVGFFGLIFVNTLFNQWTVYAHAPPGSRAGAGVGTLMLMGYLLQGLLNPLVGLAGDRMRARGGTRRLLSLGAAPLLLAVFATLWRESSPVVLALGYCLLFTVVMQPWVSLLPAIATTPQVRLRMTLTGALMALVASGVALLAGPLLVERFGLGALSSVGAVVFVLTVLIPAVLVREPAARAPARMDSSGPLMEQLAAVGRSVVVRRFVAGSMLLTATLMSLVVSAPYVAGAVLHRSQSATSVLNGFLVAGMLVSVAVLARLGKRVAPLTLLLAGAVVALCVLVVLSGVTVLPPGPVTWTVCAAGFFALGSVALSVLVLPSLVAAKLSDEDGRGREGLFFGLSGVATCFGNALGAFAASNLLSLARDASDPTGLQATLAIATLFAAAAVVVLPKGAQKPATAPGEAEERPARSDQGTDRGIG
jgi:Na+/melibiose symporter-like transporter